MGCTLLQFTIHYMFGLNMPSSGQRNKKWSHDVQSVAVTYNKCMSNARYMQNTQNTVTGSLASLFR